MPKRTRDYREGLLEELHDPLSAANYLDAAAAESEELFLIALRDVAEARGMSTVAADAGVAREAIYRMLSAAGNPTYANFTRILAAVGLRVRVEPVGLAGDLYGSDAHNENIVLGGHHHSLSQGAPPLGELSDRSTMSRRGNAKTMPIRSKRLPEKIVALRKKPSRYSANGAQSSGLLALAG